MARSRILFVTVVSLSTLLRAQDPATKAPATGASPEAPIQTLRTTSRAVLIDVIVSDRKGKPVTGLKQEDFIVTEQGKV